MSKRLEEILDNTGNVDGYMLLASAIIEAYGDDYSELFPRNATSQYEFTLLDEKNFRRERERLLNNLTHSVVGRILDEDVVRTAFNNRLRNEMKIQDIYYKINL